MKKVNKDYFFKNYFLGKQIFCESIDQKQKMVKILISLGFIFKDGNKLQDYETCSCCSYVRIFNNSRKHFLITIESENYITINFSSINLNNFKIYKPKWKGIWK